MNGPSAGDLAIGAAGALFVLVALGDMFVTIFNYDGTSAGVTRSSGTGDENTYEQYRAGCRSRIAITWY